MLPCRAQLIHNWLISQERPRAILIQSIAILPLLHIRVAHPRRRASLKHLSLSLFPDIYSPPR